jgi:hypothetical protein
MSLFHNNILAGASGGSDPIYVDDVFSTFLYTGAGSAQTITNGIDLAGEGGLVWTKRRTATRSHILFDSERGASSRLLADLDHGAANQPYSITMNSNGYSWSASDNDVTTGGDFCSWTFRKCPGFFDIVTYTGNGTSGRTIAHSLGSVPGCIMVKRTSDQGDWSVYHRANKGFIASDPISNLHLHLNQNHTAQGSSAYWNDTDPTSTVFTVGNSNDVNQNGETYVAYLFAHDDQSFGADGDKAIIKCGSYTGDGGSQNKVDVGFEPQWLLIKRTQTSSANWMLFDNMRGIGYKDAQEAIFYANETDTESEAQRIAPEHDGFRCTDSAADINASGSNYIYIAIDRPNKPTNTATDVFNVQTFNNNTSAVEGVSFAFVIDNIGFPPDVTITKVRSQALHQILTTRLSTHEGGLFTAASSDNQNRDAKMVQEKVILQGTYADASVSTVAWNFKRSHGFFDCLNYRGTNNTRTVTHSLGVVPELIIVKSLDNNRNWKILAAGLLGNNKYLELNNNIGATTDIHLFNSTSPTASVFTVGADVNVSTNNENYLALLFATKPGVSKIGTYTGTGSNIDVDCGFTNGARFVMIKRTDSSDNWVVWDTARGINSGAADPYLRFNLSNAEVTTNDFIDPLSSGFTVGTGSFSVNASGGTYLFLAIA